MRSGTVMRADGRRWASRCWRASTFWSRMRGLLGRKGLGPGEALLIDRCGSVHTVGMRFALDLVFVDRAWRVLRVVRGVPPGRWMVSGGWRAARVYESEAGRLDCGGLAVGEALRWQADGNGPARG